MNMDTTASRFLRPTDLARLRRNQRRIQASRLLIILRNVAVVGIVVVVIGGDFLKASREQPD